MGNSAEHCSARATALASRTSSEASCNTQIVRSPTTHQASEDTQILGVGTAIREKLEVQLMAIIIYWKYETITQVAVLRYVVTNGQLY